MMVHPRDAPITYPTVMTERGFESLALTAHAKRLVRRAHLPSHHLVRHGRLRDAPRIGERRLGVTGQGHAANYHVRRREDWRHAARDSEGGERPGRVAQEEPYQECHDLLK